MRRMMMLGAAAALACSGTLVSAGVASAATTASDPYTDCSYVYNSGDLAGYACWDPGATTMQICDTLADGDTPYAYIQTNGGGHLPFSDGFGAGSCDYVYPYAGTFELGSGSSGKISFYAALVNSSGTVVSVGNTETAPW